MTGARERIEAEARKPSFDDAGASLGVLGVLKMHRIDVQTGTLASVPVEPASSLCRVPGGWWIASERGMVPVPDARLPEAPFLPDGFAEGSGRFLAAAAKGRVVVARGARAVVIDSATRGVDATLELPALAGMDAPFVNAVAMSRDGAKIAVVINSSVALYAGDGALLLGP